jgi:hypothetical protein
MLEFFPTLYLRFKDRLNLTRVLPKLLYIGIGWQIGSIVLTNPAIAQPIAPSQKLDLPPEVIENSPVLRKWLKGVPNVLEDIRHDPSFRTRLRFGFSWFPSTNDAVGINLGVEDIFIDRTGLTISGNYQAVFNGNRLSTGANLHYFLFPLGGYVNFAPLLGYRYVQSNDFNTDGLNLGARLMLALSRTGAADLSLSQSFISPGGNNEVGITSLSVGYAVTSNLRLSSDLEFQNSREDKDRRFGINLEWLL